MPIRIAGKLLPDNKRAQFALAGLFGVGITRAQVILNASGIDINIKLKDMSEKDVASIREYIEKNYTVEGDLRREIISNIQRLKQIKCYRGIRHMRGLPVHGQRTKTNSRTVRGNSRKTMGSGRKDAPGPK